MFSQGRKNGKKEYWIDGMLDEWNIGMMEE